MATTTMTLIAKQTVSVDGVTSVTISNIPQNFKDLVIRSSTRYVTASTGGWQDVLTTFNGTSTGYSETLMWGNGDAAGTGASSVLSPAKSNISWAQFATTGTSPANTFNNAEVYISNYSSSSSYKTISGVTVTEKQATISGSSINSKTSGVWANNAPITSMTFEIIAGGFVRGSSFYVYGISDASSQVTLNIPYALGGDTITNDGTYWSHAFLFSNTFRPFKTVNCDYLVIAGGGGGGAGSNAGGGGAGGYLTGSNKVFYDSGTYTMTVGAGGAGGTVNTSGSKGSNSVMHDVTAEGGGFGAGTSRGNGGSGGSGGGAGYPSGSGGIATSGQGNNGGSGGSGAPAYSAGGGGGAGSAGGNGTNLVGSGIGGNGLSSSITGTSVTRAGGGGAGNDTTTVQSGGSGGGGNGAGASTTSATSGAPSTGSGGGGGSSAATGGNGGSGIIIVRYPI